MLLPGGPMRFFSYLVAAAVVPASLVLAIVEGGLWLWLPPALVFAIVPSLDHLLPIDRVNPSDDAPPWALPWQLLVRAWVPLQLGILVLGFAAVVASYALLWQRALLVVDLGILSGAVGITFAHELMHRSNRFDRALGEILMAVVGYTWFCIEHVSGHHRRVATFDDPATSRLGESLYAFLPRTIVGGFRSAVSLERQRCERRKIGTFDLRNRLTRYALGLIALQVAVIAAFGALGWLVWAAHAVVAVLLLETINYLEHYGLQRVATGERDGAQVYERVQPHHSWNSGHAVSNRILANLARHSDHHANASRPWEQLRHVETVPQLPTGYGGMVLLTMVPPLWFRVMNPRVERARAEIAAPSTAGRARSASAGAVSDAELGRTAGDALVGVGG